ncbi:MAG TPA: hypothetical protein VEI03_21245 [Stellaceae bacterium]|nr:hypothetical protein [Stellaceae bacterium]
MISALLGSVLSLLFFSAVLAAEIRGGDRHRIRELAILVGILTLVAAYASHVVIAGGWPEIASLSSLILRGG